MHRVGQIELVPEDVRGFSQVLEEFMGGGDKGAREQKYQDNNLGDYLRQAWLVTQHHH